MSRPLRFIRKEYRKTIASSDLIAPISTLPFETLPVDLSERLSGVSPLTGPAPRLRQSESPPPHQASISARLSSTNPGPWPKLSMGIPAPLSAVSPALLAFSRGRRT
jgi:hypothetical protein